jgi:L-histidine N-alpha-methyltransferase
MEEQSLQGDVIESLRTNRLDPKLLYVTSRQAELWRQVFLHHSPIHANPEFARIYQDAFARIAGQLKGQKRMLVGLGCGTGHKELQFHSDLKAGGCEVLFSAIDGSRDLVLESAKKLIEAGADHRRSLVCDLARTAFLEKWLDGMESRLPRVITFFGLVPNFSPLAVTRLLHSVLRPGDIMLASAHLAPARAEKPGEIRSAMNSILPQYDNRETLEWLAEALKTWDLESLVEPPQMSIGEWEGIPAFLAFAAWRKAVPFEKWGRSFSPKMEEPLRLFFSLRHTPGMFEDVLRRAGFSAGLLSITSCRQEAIWCIRRV